MRKWHIIADYNMSYQQFIITFCQNIYFSESPQTIVGDYVLAQDRLKTKRFDTFNSVIPTITSGKKDLSKN